MECMNRRQFFGLSTAAVSSLLFSGLIVPSVASAEELNAEMISHEIVNSKAIVPATFDCVGMTSQQTDLVLQSIVRQEVQQLIDADVASSNSTGSMSVRPKI